MFNCKYKESMPERNFGVNINAFINKAEAYLDGDT